MVATSAFDLNDSVPYSNVILNKWNKVLLLAGCSIPVWYNAKPIIYPKTFRKIFDDAKPDVIFINGLFTSWMLVPLYINRIGGLRNAKVILSPRGMLQMGALNSGARKKYLFLKVLGTLGFFKNICWHATTTDEKDDIKREIAADVNVYVAENIPKMPIPSFLAINKVSGELRLVYISLISKKKNLLLLIRSLKTLTSNITLDIYGPIKDEKYWQYCMKEIKSLPTELKIKYKGEIQPFQVQQIIQEYHALVLLTKGENFGHALFESLSVGRPIITSNFTPWNDLKKNEAGWNLDIENEETIRSQFMEITDLNNIEFNKYAEGALRFASRYFETSKFIQHYKMIFAE